MRIWQKQPNDNLQIFEREKSRFQANRVIFDIIKQIKNIA